MRQLVRVLGLKESVSMTIGTFKEPKPEKMKKLNRQYRRWKIAAVVASLVAIILYGFTCMMW